MLHDSYSRLSSRAMKFCRNFCTVFRPNQMFSVLCISILLWIKIMYYFHIRGGPILLRRIIFVKVFFHRTTKDIPSVEFDLQIVLSYICAFKISLLRILLSKDWKKKKRYNNINVSIAKILGLVVKEEGLFFIFFFHSIHRSGKNLDSQRRFKWFPVETRRLLLFSNLLSPLFSPLFFITLFFHNNPLRYKSRFYSNELEPIEVYRILKSIEEKCYSV